MNDIFLREFVSKLQSIQKLMMYVLNGFVLDIYLRKLVQQGTLKLSFINPFIQKSCLPAAPVSWSGNGTKLQHPKTVHLPQYKHWRCVKALIY